MFGLSFFNRAPIWLLSITFKYILPVIFIVSKFIGTLKGVLLLSLLLYFYLDIFGDSKPLNFAQLVLWLDQLEADSITSIITTIITIIGFMIAFHTANLNWKAQAKAQMQVVIANEIDEFYSEANSLITDAKLYVDSLAKAAIQLQTKGLNEETTFSVDYNLDRANSFRATRDRLSKMSVDVYKITSRNYSLLAASWGAAKVLQMCSDKLREIADSMWIHIPVIIPNDPNRYQSFLSQVDLFAYEKFVNTCEKNADFINGNVGGIRGLLISPIIGMNLPMLLDILKNRKNLLEAMNKIRS